MQVVGFVVLTLVVMATSEFVNGIEQLQSIMDELDFMEEEENLTTLSTGETGNKRAEEQAWMELCDQVVQSEIKVPKGIDEFKTTVKKKLTAWNRCSGHWLNWEAIADWDYSTDLNQQNNDKLTAVAVNFSKWQSKLIRNAKKYKANVMYTKLDPDSQRQIRLFAFGTNPKHDVDLQSLVRISNDLQSIYSEAKVKSGSKTLRLEPHLTNIMAKCNSSRELRDAWTHWRNVTGPLMRDKYADLTRLLNVGAVDNGFSSYADAWMSDQFDDTGDIENLSEQLWRELKPLYEQLHAYVRDKLYEKCENDSDFCDTAEKHNNGLIFKSGGIPAHLTGNMWAQSWENIYKIVKPYPEVKETDYDIEMKNQNYTVDTLFVAAEEFYTSIGLYKMTEKFNKYSMKRRPVGKDVICHASASDFYNEEDYRIKMCTEIDLSYFETVHHEMGHIEYFMGYKDQPTIYRNGANSGFHEAIGDTISLSVLTPQHLQTIGLANASTAQDISMEYKRDINFLIRRALFKIAFLPFAYMIDKWRWEVFKGVTKKTEYNERWWQLRLKYQGIVSPVERSERDFDPGAKFHIPSNSPYICYFISFITQFQFYEAMCKASGHMGELHYCDLYRSTAAGDKMKAMLELGKSKPWPEAMEKLTGSTKISTDSILKYFEPLQQWLQDTNNKRRATSGWKDAKINWKHKNKSIKSSLYKLIKSLLND